MSRSVFATSYLAVCCGKDPAAWQRWAATRWLWLRQLTPIGTTTRGRLRLKEVEAMRLEPVFGKMGSLTESPHRLWINKKPPSWMALCRFRGWLSCRLHLATTPVSEPQAAQGDC